MGAQKERQGLAMELNINGELVNARFSEPNQSQIFELDKFYRKVFAECLREGILTESEAKKRFEETGAWSKEDDKNVNNLIQKVAFNSVLLSEMDELSEEAADLIALIQEDRNSMLEMLSRKTDLFSNTAEGMANEQRVYKFVSMCLVDESGTPIAGSEAELENLSANNKEAFDEVMRAAYSKVYNVDLDETDITSNWAEVEFMKKIADKPETAEEETSEE
jgi:acyl carrier protein phosphodiesterase